MRASKITIKISMETFGNLVMNLMEKQGKNNEEIFERARKHGLFNKIQTSFKAAATVPQGTGPRASQYQ